MFKNKLTNEALDLKASIYKRIANPFYIIVVALTALGTYGFYLTHPSPSIDWLSYDEYYSGILFGQGRFTATIVERIFGLWDCPVWFEPLLGIACFILGTLIMLAIFDGFTEYKSIVPSIVFTCVYISFPLLPEYFIYNGAVLTVGGCTLMLAAALYLEIKYTDFVRSLLVPIILMIAVFSWYECMILPYVGLVFAILILKDRRDNGMKACEVIQKGISPAIVLILGVVFEGLISKLAIKLFAIETNTYARTSSYWTADFNAVMRLIQSYSSYWALKVFCNPAFTILFIAGITAVILFIINIKKKKGGSSVVLFVGSLIPVFAMTLYRCGGAEYRTEQGMPFFVAFTAYFVSICIRPNKQAVNRIIAALFAFVLIIQIGASNKCYWINNQRYEEEKNVILELNNRISENHDINKPVVFLGSYTMTESFNRTITVDKSSWLGKIIKRFASDNSYEKALKKYDYLGKSYINWSTNNFFDENKPSAELYKFCSYFGVTFKQCTKEQRDDAIKKYSDIEAYPSKNCIAETDDYIVVKF